jgi:PII-like signaling protein
MRGIEGEQTLLRIILSESRMHRGTPLHQVILDLLRAEGLAGVTVLKGHSGFGHDRDVHTVAIEVAAVGLPIVLEVVDTGERIEAVLTKLDRLLAGGVVTLERARVIRYAGIPPTA